MANAWLFQCNADKRWDIGAKLANDGEIERWSIRRYRESLAPGDDAVLWLSGPDGGVCGIGRVTGYPIMDFAGGDRFWYDEEDRRKRLLWCPVRFDRLF